MIESTKTRIMFDYYKTYTHKDNVISDIYDGQIWNDVMNNDEMKDCDLKIGLSMCFDGMDIYSSGNNTGQISSLEISILNFDHKYRNKPGLGMKLVILFSNVEEDSVANDELMKLFIDELNELYRGIDYNENGETKKAKAALLYICSDTKGYEKLFKVQGPASLAGCYKCNGFTGTYQPLLKKTVYIGHRMFLSSNHPYRKIKSNYGNINYFIIML